MSDTGQRIIGRGPAGAHLDGISLYELLAKATTDARIQLDSARGLARLFGSGSDTVVEKAEARWRRQNPGLAALIDHKDGAS